jgi:hypothetical protein
MLDDVLSPAALGGVSASSVYRKVQWGTLPLMCLISAACYIDRTNLAFASMHLTYDLEFTPKGGSRRHTQA